MKLSNKLRRFLIDTFMSIRYSAGIPEKKRLYPYRVFMNELLPDGCTFEITTPTESFRVEKFGDEKEFTQLILNEIHPSNVFFDIGACVGLVSVYAARKGANVIAFEPDLIYRSRLLKNLMLNDLHNVKIIEWAVSDEHGETYLYTEENADGRSPSLRNDGNRKAVKVFTDTIDDALARNELPKPDILKMDIEGAEILALRGMKNLLDSNPPRTIFIEIHPTFLPSFNSTADEVERLIESYGYRVDYKVIRSNTPEVQCIHSRYRKI